MTKKPKLSSLFIFLAVTYALSWACWIPLALWHQSYTLFPNLLLFILGGSGPSITGIFMVYFTREKRDRADFWKRVINIRQIGFERTAIALLLCPTIFVTAMIAAGLTNVDMPGLDSFIQVLQQPLTLIPLLLVGFFAGPLSEELGWRGFALDILQSRWSPILSSFFLGFFWWAWHLPLFAIVGTTQYTFGVGTPAFWMFAIGIFPLSLLQTWLYNQTRRSILAAILFHFSYNFTYSLAFPVPEHMDVFKTLLLALIAAMLVFFGQGLQNRAVEASGERQEI